jgi:ATP-dependent helicase/nuclease subunit A
MVQASLKTAEIRDISPNVLQRQASDPGISAWVSASAGSGKTKVLTDRMLRLMLPNKNRQEGTPAHKILALTFTKAGANEMALRINERLSEWAVSAKSDKEAEEKLKKDLKDLLGYNPGDNQIESARKLFAHVVDAPGGLKIMTIHSFCQSVLGRFPLEAGLTPNFKALDENQARIIMQRARNLILHESAQMPGSPLLTAVRHIATVNNEEQFNGLLSALLSERKQLREILEKHFGSDGLYTALCQYLDIKPGQNAEDLILDFSDTNNFDETGLRKACTALSESGSVKDAERSLIIQQWLDLPEKERLQNYDGYKFAFLTKTNETIIKNLATKKAVTAYPDIEAVLGQEAQRILALENHLAAMEVATLTRDLFLIAQQVLERYDTLKSAENGLDYDDLILKALDLLQGRSAPLNGMDVTPWIRFKLDQGIDHILVDEAQDTNPEQWEIIDAISDDFFQDEEERTLFVVGDDKQSIFSFQRAAPEKFNAMKKFFAEKITTAQKNMDVIDFNISFRSAPALLDMVDRVFKTIDLHEPSSAPEPVTHKSFRYKQPGLVELWPLFESQKQEEFDPWAPPVDISDSSSGAAQMAGHIAATIAGWLQKGEKLESYDRAIEPGDIMILVRSRTAFIDQLVRALKTNNIPVSGIDRMVLGEQLVVQDLCAAAQFALLPEDDLNLAALLKTPFIGLDEETLFDIAHGRGHKSLWQSVKEKAPADITGWLEALIPLGSQIRPYDFFSSILQQPCPAAETSGLKAIKQRLGAECLDPLDEFLNSALNFETDNNPTLQTFLQAHQASQSDIKRQMEEQTNMVRIMTVHGAKGLQAPIVFLPDTVRTGSSNKPERLFWPDRTGQSLPFYCPPLKRLPQPCSAAKETLNAAQDREYRRLLYVAMTRAESRLYIGGYKNTRDPIDDSWYRYIEKAFEASGDIETSDSPIGDIHRLSNPATDGPDRAPKNTAVIKQNNAPRPDWLFQPMPEEPDPPRPLIPSRPSKEEELVSSPLREKDTHRFTRGNVTHKLLQILPDLPPEKREKAAADYTALPIHGLSENVQRSIVSETLDILNNTDFAAIFGPGSMAEVPVTGLLDDKTLISGQIDRLLITDREILIVDYKTNRPPPSQLADVPDIYKNQMRAYREIIAKLYPKRTIRAALIWTDGARLMEIPDS